MLGTGSPLEVKLRPGEHTITVVLDDGTDQVEDGFVIRVKEEEEGSPGPGLVAAIGGRGAGWPRYGSAEGLAALAIQRALSTSWSALTLLSFSKTLSLPCLRNEAARVCGRGAAR